MSLNSGYTILNYLVTLFRLCVCLRFISCILVTCANAGIIQVMSPQFGLPLSNFSFFNKYPDMVWSRARNNTNGAFVGGVNILWIDYPLCMLDSCPNILKIDYILKFPCLFSSIYDINWACFRKRVKWRNKPHLLCTIANSAWILYVDIESDILDSFRPKGSAGK